MAKQLVAATDFSLVEKTADQAVHSCKAGQVCKLPSDLADLALAKGLVIEETIPAKAGKKKAPRGRSIDAVASDLGLGE